MLSWELFTLFIDLIFSPKSGFQQLHLNSCFLFTWGWLRARRFTEQLIKSFSDAQRSLTCHHCCLPLVSELHLESALDSSKTHPETPVGIRVSLAIRQLNTPYLAVSFFASDGCFCDTWSESQNSPGQEQLEQLAFSFLGMTHMPGSASGALPLTSWLRSARAPGRRRWFTWEVG